MLSNDAAYLNSKSIKRNCTLKFSSKLDDTSTAFKKNEPTVHCLLGSAQQNKKYNKNGINVLDATKYLKSNLEFGKKMYFKNCPGSVLNASAFLEISLLKTLMLV